MTSYAVKIRELLSPAERKIFERLNTPQKIQDYLDTLPVNYERAGERVKADVLLGDDGIARAIRFVH